MPAVSKCDPDMPDQAAAHTMDVYQAALDQLIGYGLEVEHLDTTCVLRRVRHRDDKRSRKDGWYVAHELSLADGRHLIAGAFGWWRDDCGTYKIGGQARGLSDADQAEYARLRCEARKAAERAAKLWPRLPEMGSSRYLQVKYVQAHGVKFSRGGGLVVPVRKVTGQLVGLQFIRLTFPL
ncbi:MAG: hypothetical protein U9R74_16745 [Pseudomonadota bacterium]|nr:hypothetical protein [Pseudomonadota bacterium]